MRRRVTLLILLTFPCLIYRALAMSGIEAPKLRFTPSSFAPQQSSQTQQPTSAFAALIATYVRLDSSGHSPTVDDIAAMATLQPRPDAAGVQAAIPYLLKALGSPDIPLRSFALTALSGLQSPPETIPPATPPPNAPISFKPDIAKQLTPIIPQIATHLTDESQPDRLLTAAVLGGFTPNAPASVFPPLLAFLKRDDAIGVVGLAVITDLLQFSPIADDTAAAIIRYLRRSDQTSESRSNLVDAIASNPRQSQSIDKALLTYLDSDDDSLRARVILSLPQLDLAPDVFADMQSRVSVLAANSSENLQVVTAAKSVTTCWTATKMPAGCPAYQ